MDSLDSFLISDSFLMVWIIYEGSLSFPLWGEGAKYGESVSTKMFSIGIDEIVIARSSDFLNFLTGLYISLFETEHL